jgi:hypothetical protein
VPPLPLVTRHGTQPLARSVDTRGMTTCPVLTRLWMISLARVELDDTTMRVVMRLLDRRRYDG